MRRSDARFQLFGRALCQVQPAHRSACHARHFLRGKCVAGGL